MTRLLIIIPAEILDAVRAAGGGTFVAAGSPTGDAPATHWWQSGRMTDDEVTQFTALYAGFPTAKLEAYSLMRQAGRPWGLLGEMGLMPMKLEGGTP
jgi:hypothetical protein